MAGEIVQLSGITPKLVQVISKPVRKRDNDDSDLPNKRRKSTDDKIPGCSTKITDVIDDCLEVIFGHLQFKDLSCAAIAHEHFRVAAGLIFGRKYGQKEIRLMSDGITVFHDDNHKHSVYHGFSVKKPSYYMEFLQSLGGRISKLNIGLGNGLYKTIEPTLLKTCVDSLVELTLHYPHLGPSKLLDVFAGIKKPFPNVVKLCLHGCHLNKQASRLGVWFPKLQRLTIFDSTFGDAKLVVTKYPLLEHFSVGGWKDENTLTQSQIYAMLRLNPQIHSLDIGLAADGYELDIYRRINKILPQLQNLNLCWEMNSFKQHDGKKVTFKNVKSLVLDFGFNSFSGARVLPLVFSQLTELEINNIPLLTGDWMDFIVQHKALTKLSVLPFNEYEFYFDRPNNQDLMRLGKELSNLNTLTIDATEISTICLLQFMQMSKTLTELRLHWNDCYAFTSFHHDLLQHGPGIFAQIRDHWHIPPKITNPFVLKRKAD
ncbi:uncharacterized protein LOC129568117 [Sitodiplosis mosellana]|uniref:uncharacterized protein LOC129568117 n=1 Tax=Sitodiplosis mosellana TaxID=263140 RepID=UPI0024453217|nr:uncharacterized protein LOC129568117 [Sitodiplosis mosellana]XP_055301658.1 uncharacterized protein LOC129568117 [Sitodiplosis mosellana]